MGAMTTLAPTIPLAGGARMPALGLGTWPLDNDEVERVVTTALGLGYRLVDTAENYHNERGVGRAVRGCGLPREEVFVTTKINREWHEDAIAGVRGNLERLGLDYVDLVLIHWPNPDQGLYVHAWQGLLEAREQGLVRAVGVSNFTPSHLDRLIRSTGVAPEVNQIQCSPYHPRVAERAHHERLGVVTESWSPLGANHDLLAEPAVARIAEAHGVTPGQAVLAWHVRQGLVPIPKSSDPTRLAQNLDVFGIALSEAEIAELGALRNDHYRLTDPDRFGH